MVADISGAVASQQSSSSGADIPMENDWEYNYGRVDAGIEENLDLVEAIPLSELPSTHPRYETLLLGAEEGSSSGCTIASHLSPDVKSSKTSRGSLLSSLPSELIDQVLSFLSPIDLVSVSVLSHHLLDHSRKDCLWQRHVQENIPGIRLSTPGRFGSYRELYIAHDPYWFLPKYKLWFSDHFLTGRLIIARYDPRRQCIEGYRLLAERAPPTFAPWEHDDGVIIHSFDPKCRLHIDEPFLQLNPLTITSEKKPTFRSFGEEVPMPITERVPPAYLSNLILARPVQPYPSMQTWPPLNIPARHRVRSISTDGFASTGHKPNKRSEISSQAFRVKRWIEMGGQGSPRVHIGEEINTFATLDPRVYTPTEDKPYRGIWIGDYSGHGCEFLLMNQPDDETPFDASTLTKGEFETPEEFELRKKHERIYRGSIEAIKLTGDPNVPRGEYTFVADDLGEKGYVRKGTCDRFKGARIVKSRGHIAARMFRNDKYIESQLILISPDRLAQYWVGFGHISYFQRVNIDEFLTPAGLETNADPGPST